MLVEVFDGVDATEPLFISEFGVVPRVGESIAREMDGYFRYYKVWHRQRGKNADFQTCIRVELED